MKVEFLRSTDTIKLEEIINQFISCEEIEVVDIKFQPIKKDIEIELIAMIMYRDKQEIMEQYEDAIVANEMQTRVPLFFPDKNSNLVRLNED